jgi:Fic family protein
VRGTLVDRLWEAEPGLYAPPRYRRPCRYDAFLPQQLAQLPDLDVRVAGVVSAAETAIRDLNADAQPALDPLARLLRRTESIASSKVEGMQVDARALARAEARAGAGQRIGPEAAEILANIDAMQLAVEETAAADAISVEHLVSIHAALLAGNRIAGRIRDRQNWIGGNDYNPCDADYVPPPPEVLADLLEDLVAFCNDDELSPLAQAALAHAQFETIHPFEDGNGRTGRALVQVLLRRRGLAPSYVPPISVVLAADKERYIRGLTAFREGRENEWLESFAVAAARSAELASGYLREVRELQEEWRSRVGTSVRRADAAVWLLIEQLPAHPVISARIASALVPRTKPAVNQAIAQLVEARVLVPLGEGQRNRLWEVDGLLDLLADLDAAVPPPVIRSS